MVVTFLGSTRTMKRANLARCFEGEVCLWLSFSLGLCFHSFNQVGKIQLQAKPDVIIASFNLGNFEQTA